jgi:hypothetical protein
MDIPFVEKTEVRIPYNLTLDQVELNEPRPHNARHTVMYWLGDMDADSMARIVLAAAVLFENTAEHVDMWTCLHEAIVWERG